MSARKKPKAKHLEAFTGLYDRLTDLVPTIRELDLDVMIEVNGQKGERTLSVVLSEPGRRLRRYGGCSCRPRRRRPRKRRTTKAKAKG